MMATVGSSIVTVAELFGEAAMLTALVTPATTLLSVSTTVSLLSQTLSVSTSMLIVADIAPAETVT